MRLMLILVSVLAMAVGGMGKLKLRGPCTCPPDLPGPVCASDMRTYQNICEMYCFSDDDNVKPLWLGTCDQPPNPPFPPYPPYNPPYPPYNPPYYPPYYPDNGPYYPIPPYPIDGRLPPVPIDNGPLPPYLINNGPSPIPNGGIHPLISPGPNA